MPPLAELVAPAHRTGPEFDQTLGPEVADLCEMIGFAPDPEQRMALDLIFALDGAGNSATFEAGVVAPRQNLKTGLFKQSVIGWLFLTKQRLIVWSAHEFSTTREALRDLDQLIGGAPFLSRHVKRVLYANGQESIELVDGRRVIFRARTKTGGRGLTGDKVVLDEAFALTADHMGALLPTMAARPDPQILYGSSAGMAGSEVLRGIRDRGRAGDERLAYLEWCAPREGCEDPACTHAVGTEGCALDRRGLLEQANPALGRRITMERLRAFRRSMPPGEFAREFLGWWDDPTGAELFGPGAWTENQTITNPTTKTSGLGLAVSYDLAWACFAGAAADGDRVHVRPLHHAPRTGWVVAKAIELQGKTGLPVVVDERGPASDLIQPLKDAGVHVRTVDTGEVLDACALVWKLVQDRLLAHQGYEELDAAVGAAVKRPVADRFAWGRKQSSGDISPLEAVTLAAWAARWPSRSAYDDEDAELMVV